MKLMTPDGSELMHVKSVDVRNGQLVVEGIIMGAIPMTAVATPKEMRSSLKLLSMKKLLMLICLMFRR
jgi:hypothetical protein